MPGEVGTWPTLTKAMGWDKPREALVDRVMKEIGQVDDKAACRRHLADAIEQVARYEYIAPGERRRQLKATANTLKRALKNAKGLPDLRRCACSQTLSIARQFFTIGHPTRSLDEFLGLLSDAEIITDYLVAAGETVFRILGRNRIDAAHPVQAFGGLKSA